jgi:hypothetical protein
MNLSLDHFDDAYVDRMSSTRCPECRTKSSLGAIVSRFKEDSLTMRFSATPLPVPVVLYRERHLFKQPKAHRLIKRWLVSQDRSGIEKLVRIIEQTRSPLVPDWPRDDSLREIVFDWMVLNKTQEHELWARVVYNRQSDQAPE